MTALARASCELGLFQCVMKLCEERIHGRLESDHWTRPRHQPGRLRQPLHQALRKLVSSLKIVRSNAPRSIQDLRQELIDLANTYQAVDRCSNNPDKRVEAVKMAVRQSYSVCTSNGKCSLESTVLAHGLDPKFVCEERVIRQVNKIGRYWGLCHDMTDDSRRYRSLFENTQLECLQPFTAIRSRIYAKTTRKRAVKCHVHAEIQMLVHHDQELSANTIKPRVIGVNKSACYLCNLFFQYRRQYFLTKTHGHLYDQWTLPDLATFTYQQRNEYRRIIAAMSVEMETAVKRQPPRKRAAPTGSWISLPTPPQTTPLASDAGTIVSGDAMKAPRPLTPKSLTPRGSPRSSAERGETTALRASPTSSIPLARSRSSSTSRPSTLPHCDSPVAPPLVGSPHTQPFTQPSPSINPAISAHLATSPHSVLVPATTTNEPPPTPPDHYPSPQIHTQISSSTISLHPLSTPLIHTFTANRPLRLYTSNLYTILEIESGTGEVKASITDLSRYTDGEAVNVHVMRPGEEISRSRDGDDEAVNLLVKEAPGGRAVRMELRWVT